MKELVLVHPSLPSDTFQLFAKIDEAARRARIDAADIERVVFANMPDIGAELVEQIIRQFRRVNLVEFRSCQSVIPEAVLRLAAGFPAYRRNIRWVFSGSNYLNPPRGIRSNDPRISYAGRVDVGIPRNQQNVRRHVRLARGSVVEQIDRLQNGDEVFIWGGLKGNENNEVSKEFENVHPLDVRRLVINTTMPLDVGTIIAFMDKMPRLECIEFCGCPLFRVADLEELLEAALQNGIQEIPRLFLFSGHSKTLRPDELDVFRLPLLLHTMVAENTISIASVQRSDEAR